MPKKLNILPRFCRWTLRGLATLLVLLAVYAVAVAVGHFPVNSDFEPPAEGGVEIFVFSGAFHSDLILPVEAAGFSWWDFLDKESFPKLPTSQTHVMVGWGDRKFYTETPTWKDAKVSTIGKAMFWPTETVMHVGLGYEPETGEEVRSIRVSEDQYRNLLTFVKAHFARDSNDDLQKLSASFGDYDIFYQAHGSYHLFRTCNCWAGEALKSAGVKVGCWTPLPKTVFWHLPEQDE